MNTTRVTQFTSASRAAVYCACLDPVAVAKWMVPDGMTSNVHAFNAREGGEFRISLAYDEPTGTGKTSAHTDTFHGRFLTLVPNEQIVQAVKFETDNPSLLGEMRITITLRDKGGGTEIEYVHDGIPEGVRPEDNELGTRLSLAKLAALAERG